MFLVGITVFFILVGIGFFIWGAIALSKYAFRLGTGQGLLTLLFPPYTFYFALFKLEEEGKSWPTASWLFGLVVTVLLTVAFWPALNALATGNTAQFEGKSAAAVAEEEAEEAQAEQEAIEEQVEEELAEEAEAEESEGDEDGEEADAEEEGEEAEGDEEAAGDEGDEEEEDE